MPYTLYSSPGACSMAVHITLNEVGVPFTYMPTVIANGETRTPAFLKLNPNGQVPVLVNNEGQTQLEGAAQMVYLLDTYGDGTLLPKSGWHRAQALQDLMFGNATLHGTYSKWFWCMKQNAPTELTNHAANAIQNLWGQIEARLEASEGPYLQGAECRMGDILLSVIANWSDKFAFGPKTQAMFKLVRQRPAYEKTRATENVTYKLAA
jgi:glutathione S-transferase